MTTNINQSSTATAVPTQATTIIGALLCGAALLACVLPFTLPFPPPSYVAMAAVDLGRPADRSPAITAQAASSAAIRGKDGWQSAAQFNAAIIANVDPAMRARLTPIVAAIRFAENGGPGREYGILHPRVEPTYRSQAGWCAATVQKNWDRWGGAGSPGSFIAFLGARYCPIGADNDPTGLNSHWVSNVNHFLEKITGK